MFNVIAFYSQFAIADPLGIFNGVYPLCCRWLPLVVANIGAGQSAVVRVDYFNGATGAAPDDGSPITLQVLGSDGSGGLFAVNQDLVHHTVAAGWGWWVDCRRKGNKGPVPQDDGGSTNMFGLEAPDQGVRLSECDQPDLSGAGVGGESVRDSALGDCGTASAAGRYGGQHGWLGRWRVDRVDQRPGHEWRGGAIRSASRFLCCLAIKPTYRRLQSCSAMELVRIA